MARSTGGEPGVKRPGPLEPLWTIAFKTFVETHFVHLVKRARRLIALLLAFTFLFGQIASAAHACDVIGGQPPVFHSEPSGNAGDAVPELQNVCIEHCSSGTKTSGEKSASLAVASPAAASFLRVQLAVLSAPAPDALWLREMPGSPSLNVLHCCFRI